MYTLFLIILNEIKCEYLFSVIWEFICIHVGMISIFKCELQLMLAEKIKNFKPLKYT